VNSREGHDWQEVKPRKPNENGVQVENSYQ
jgi:hypothetical protein